MRIMENALMMEQNENRKWEMGKYNSQNCGSNSENYIPRI